MRMTQKQLFISVLSVTPLTQPKPRAIKGDFVTAFNGHRMWPEQHLQQLPERNTRGKKSSFVTQCFIFQKIGFRCALETLLLGISFFHQLHIYQLCPRHDLIGVYLPSDQNSFPICFFIKIIRAWNQLFFLYIYILLTIFAIFIMSKQHISMSFLRLSAYLFAHLPLPSSFMGTEKQETASERESRIYLKIKEIKEMFFQIFILARNSCRPPATQSLSSFVSQLPWKSEANNTLLLYKSISQPNNWGPDLLLFSFFHFFWQLSL